MCSNVKIKNKIWRVGSYVKLTANNKPTTGKILKVIESSSNYFSLLILLDKPVGWGYYFSPYSREYSNIKDDRFWFIHSNGNIIDYNAELIGNNILEIE